MSPTTLHIWAGQRQENKYDTASHRLTLISVEDERWMSSELTQACREKEKDRKTLARHRLDTSVNITACDYSTLHFVLSEGKHT